MSAAVLTMAAGLGGLAGTAAADEALLRATPLILKDGRIANVSVHVVGFAQGQSALASADARQLRGLTEDVATDCFLTAQVIGHVGSAEVAGSDTLNAHRLARSRADAVQASLIEGGLPAKAIASVWDWQFMVREPRATLWVFRLTPGEDCEDAPLDAAAPALVAQVDPDQPAAANGAPPAVRPPQPRAETAEPPQATRPAPQAPSSPEVATRPAGPSPAPASVPTVTQALPAASPSTSVPAAADNARSRGAVIAALPGRPAAAAPARPAADPSAAGQPAAGKPAQAQPAPAQPAAAQPAAAKPAKAAPAAVTARVDPAARQAPSAAAGRPGKDERLTIVFPTNSSYFPPGASQQLGSLLRGLAAGGAYEVVLQSSVSGSRKVVGAESAEEAMRYNQWLAERRLERVREWLDRNAAGRELIFKEDYRADDDSREVVVEVRATG